MIVCTIIILWFVLHVGLNTQPNKGQNKHVEFEQTLFTYFILCSETSSRIVILLKRENLRLLKNIKKFDRYSVKGCQRYAEPASFLTSTLY